jgi:hypothetical protein
VRWSSPQAGAAILRVAEGTPLAPGARAECTALRTLSACPRREAPGAAACRSTAPARSCARRAQVGARAGRAAVPTTVGVLLTRAHRVKMLHSDRGRLSGGPARRPPAEPIPAAGCWPHAVKTARAPSTRADAKAPVCASERFHFFQKSETYGEPFYPKKTSRPPPAPAGRAPREKYFPFRADSINGPLFPPRQQVSRGAGFGAAHPR